MAAPGKMAAMVAVLWALMALAGVARAEVAPLEYDGPVQPVRERERGREGEREGERERGWE